ncbi:hypothetical protein BDM02DRAFT_3188937 [Thelephora ganbajun]|uniref:Uncharacterized protein n=1 Tax=Thelephora ganbajun TaxID=370292 RepID=A0ACB6Z9E5_THEGA|nr:hypothetical protein BDM02DRAFT_3188937 [Thelephora ganbajun]
MSRSKSLFAYHIEALIPPSPGAANASQTPQKFSGDKDVQFFTVGNLGGRTLVIYMKKNLDSVFRVLESVIGKTNKKTKAQPPIGRRSVYGLNGRNDSAFIMRVSHDPSAFLPSDSSDLLFLKARIVILCSKGFDIVDLSNFKSITIPQKGDPRSEKLAMTCELCRPMGMFKLNRDEFLLCYDEFGLYVDIV